MVRLLNQLKLIYCPHCSIANPTLTTIHRVETKTHSGENKRFWCIYVCATCGGAVTAASDQQNGLVSEIYPTPKNVDDAVPARARDYLIQAISTVHAPSGSVMLSASAVDIMLNEKGYKDGSLYERLENAAKDHLITEEMAKWAYQVRLDASDQRHSDESTKLPAEADAQKCVDFALAFAQCLFVLPSKVKRGLESAKK